LKKIAEVRAPKVEKPPAFWDWVDDKLITSNASVRYYIGDFFEEATEVALKARRLKTEAGSLCPDLRMGSGVYLECKSIGKSSDCIVFDHRMESYEVMIQSGKPLYYIFWRHVASMKGVAFVKDINERLAEAAQDVAIVPAEDVHKKMKESRVYIGKYFYAQGRPCAFRRLRSHVFAEWFETPAVMEFSGSVYGVQMQGVPVHANGDFSRNLT